MAPLSKTTNHKSWLDRLPTDVFGSDVFVAYQGSYVWQANQVGHFAIGFTLTSVIAWLCAAAGWAAAEPSLVYWLGLALVVVYAVKEYIDLLIAEHQAQGLFPYDTGELRADMLADTWFVASGVLTALAAYWEPVAGLVMAGVAIAAFLFASTLFVPARASVDRAGLPYTFRLANFPPTEGIKPHNISRVQAFITGRAVDGFDPSPAILIQGYRETGKTTLAVGIATEVANRKRPSGTGHGRALYFTGFALFERSAPAVEGTPRTIRRRRPRWLGTGDPWDLEQTEYLIIDDVDSDSRLYGGGTPAEIIEQLRKNEELFESLKVKKTVWVTGTSRFEDERAEHGWRAWMQALAGLYDCEIDDGKTADEPGEIQARYPIPVIWLRQRITSA